MLSNYLKIAFRNFWNNKFYSFLHITGLAAGITAALLIGLWVYDEYNFNRYHAAYDRIGMVEKNRTYNGTINTEESHAAALGAKLRETYGSYFDEVVVSSYGGEKTLQYGETAVTKRGYFMEKGGEKILDLQIVNGAVQFPLDPGSILLSESTAKALFGTEDPLNKTIQLDKKIALKIAGVYRDIPRNSTFRNVAFYASFDTFCSMEDWAAISKTDWTENSLPVYVKLAPKTDFADVSAKIKNVTYEATHDESKPELFLHPMSRWHLYPEFKNGQSVGLGLQNLWIFGLIGLAVLLLAAINFMNLSTARSEKRAKEIGIRKAIGSMRLQLIGQFYTETFLIVLMAGGFGLLFAQLLLPWFNRIAEKKMTFLWAQPQFWLPLAAFLLITGLIAGSYPALYLSSFKPLNALKGKFRSGVGELFSRKALVVFQFSISVALVISTIIIAQQIQFAKHRPIGYDAPGLIQIQKRSPRLSGHFFPMRQDMHDSGAIVEMVESNGPVTEMWFSQSGYMWQGKEPNLTESFITLRVTPEFGKTIGWQVVQGRDFSREFASDSSAIIINEAAARLMGFQDPLREIVRQGENNFTVIGVTKDIVMESPYAPVKPTIFTMKRANMSFITIRLNPALSVSDALQRIENVLKKYDPGGNFNFRFLDEQFGEKFWREERTANLAIAFSLMAIFISLLGIFGLASFMAEQRTREFGIRKVLGAGVFNLWALMSKDFILLVAIAFLVASPVALWFMRSWLANYEYRTAISWLVFAVAGVGALVITMCTISFQALRTALANPVKSLRSE